MVTRTIAQGFACLLFPRALEARFRSECAARRFQIMVVAGVAAVLLFGGMVLGDYLMDPAVMRLSVALRAGVFPPVVLLGLYALRRLDMPALNEWMIAFAGLLAAALDALIVLHGQADATVARIVEMNIIMVFTCAIARFWPALTMAVLTLAAHAYVVHAMPDASGVLSVATTLLLSTTAAFALYGNYKLEHDERMGFLLDMKEQALNARLAQAHERLSHMARTDALTRVGNRRFIESYLDESWQRAQREQRPIAVLVIDVDFFKAYNDRYGHQAGDRCLVAVAQALSSCLRRCGDAVARWGGEEFVVVMQDADADAAQAAAQRMLEAMAASRLPHEASACGPHVSVSVGVAAAIPGPHDAPMSLWQCADAALYDAKAGGRRQVRVRAWSPEAARIQTASGAAQ